MKTEVGLELVTNPEDDEADLDYVDSALGMRLLRFPSPSSIVLTELVRLCLGRQQGHGH